METTHLKGAVWCPRFTTLPCRAVPGRFNFVQMMDGTCFVCSHRYAYMASKELRMEAHCCSQEKKVGVPPSPSLRIYTEKKIISMDTR
jgi:hypothetical protein